MNEYHDFPTAGHYGMEKTLQRISSRYYWPGLRQYVTKYIRNYIECQRYKASNLKSADLIQTPVASQKFEILAIDHFGPLREIHGKKKWIFIIEDVSTQWVELFALEHATAEACAKILVEEIILRYGTPRRIISDNETQFVSGIMREVAYWLGIKQSLTPLYHQIET